MCFHKSLSLSLLLILMEFTINHITSVLHELNIPCSNSTNLLVPKRIDCLSIARVTNYIAHKHKRN